MNVTHLRYAVEVARTGSITRAAENLYMGQPNLSKAIRELEKSMGFQVFKRSSAGVVPTARGAEFLSKARDLLGRIAEMDSLYGSDDSRSPLRAAVPGADYAPALARFISTTGEAAWGCTLDVVDADKAIYGVGSGEYDLAVVRFEAFHAQEHGKAFDELGLISELLLEYRCCAVTQRDGTLTAENLAQGIELYCGSIHAKTQRRIFVRDRSLLMELIEQIPETYFLSTPLPEEILTRHGLKQFSVPEAPKMQDVLLLGQDASGRAGELAAHIRRVRDELKALI